MSKSPLPFYVGDVSVLARSLRSQFQKIDHIPSHVEMLNLLSKAGGYRNFQHFKAQQEACKALDIPKPQSAEIDYKLVGRLVRFFDDEGRLIRWPKKYTQRGICLWVMWSRVLARKTFTEQEMNDLLERQHLFGDYALLRRELVDWGLVVRTADGRQYKRVEVQPPAEAVELLKRLRA